MEYDYYKPGALKSGEREKYFRTPRKIRDGEWSKGETGEELEKWNYDGSKFVRE